MKYADYIFRLDVEKFWYGRNRKRIIVKNPIGYKRILNHSMREDAVRYLAWQQFVRSEFAKIFRKEIIDVRNNELAHPIRLASGQCARMEILVTWGDETHADPDNVWKGLADALFANDKHVAGGFEFTHAKGIGAVDVSIWIYGAEVDPPPLGADLIRGVKYKARDASKVHDGRVPVAKGDGSP